MKPSLPETIVCVRLRWQRCLVRIRLLVVDVAFSLKGFRQQRVDGATVLVEATAHSLVESLAAFFLAAFDLVVKARNVCLWRTTPDDEIPRVGLTDTVPVRDGRIRVPCVSVEPNGEEGDLLVLAFEGIILRGLVELQVVERDLPSLAIVKEAVLDVEIASLLVVKDVDFELARQRGNGGSFLQGTVVDGGGQAVLMLEPELLIFRAARSVLKHLGSRTAPELLCSNHGRRGFDASDLQRQPLDLFASRAGRSRVSHEHELRTIRNIVQLVPRRYRNVILSVEDQWTRGSLRPSDSFRRWGHGSIAQDKRVEGRRDFPTITLQNRSAVRPREHGLTAQHVAIVEWPERAGTGALQTCRSGSVFAPLLDWAVGEGGLGGLARFAASFRETCFKPLPVLRQWFPFESATERLTGTRKNCRRDGDALGRLRQSTTPLSSPLESVVLDCPPVRTTVGGHPHEEEGSPNPRSPCRRREGAWPGRAGQKSATSRLGSYDSDQC